MLINRAPIITSNLLSTKRQLDPQILAVSSKRTTRGDLLHFASVQLDSKSPDYKTLEITE